MAQFEVFENRDSRSNKRMPFLLDVQSDLLTSLQTHVVVPLAKPDVLRHKAIGRLMPQFDVDGTPVVMLTPELAGVSTNMLGRRVADLSAQRAAIIDALDFLLTAV